MQQAAATAVLLQLPECGQQFFDWHAIRLPAATVDVADERLSIDNHSGRIGNAKGVMPSRRDRDHRPG
jgi:hypothetical protein